MIAGRGWTSIDPSTAHRTLYIVFLYRRLLKLYKNKKKEQKQKKIIIIFSSSHSLLFLTLSLTLPKPPDNSHVQPANRQSAISHATYVSTTSQQSFNAASLITSHQSFNAASLITSHQSCNVTSHVTNWLHHGGRSIQCQQCRTQSRFQSLDCNSTSPPICFRFKQERGGNVMLTSITAGIMSENELMIQAVTPHAISYDKHCSNLGQCMMD